MASEYLITQNAGDSHQMDPNWLVAFVPMKNRISFDVVTMKSTTSALQDPAGGEALILADGDCQSVSTSSSKENHVSGAQMSLYHDRIDYRQVLAGGDWVFIWMFDNGADYQRIRAALQKGSYRSASGFDGLNGYQDGLKFVGRVSSCRRQKTRQSDGKLITTYSVAANGYQELDSTQYFNPLVSKAHPESVQYLSDFGIEIDTLLSGTHGQINSQVVIPALIQSCLGFGTPKKDNTRTKIVNWDPDNTDTGSNFEQFKNSNQNVRSENTVYQIPGTVQKILGMGSVPTIKNSQPTYMDILRVYIGVQHYFGSRSSPTSLGDFIPEITSTSNGIFYTPESLQSTFIPQAIDFNQQSVWSIAKMFLNEPVNEMYTALRIDPTGHVMPSIVARQLPMNSLHFCRNPTNVPSGAAGTGTGNNHWASTPYLTLPRWIIDDTMIYSEDTGRSDATRINYVHVSGTDVYASNPQDSNQLALLMAPPIVDKADIFRSGLRPYEAHVSAALNLVAETQNSQAASFYSQMLADTTISAHLKYQGTIQCNGIQAPIVEGDNCVIDGVIYHLERISHQCGYVDVNRGLKSFMTVLEVSNGVSTQSDTDEQGIFVYPGESGNPGLQQDDPQVNANSEGNT